MTGRQAAIAVGAGLVLVLALAWLLLSSGGDEGGRSLSTDAAEEVVAGDALALRLYFPGGAGRLVAEERKIAGAAGADLLRAATAEVLAGPTEPNLFAPFPEGTEAGTVFISDGGIAFVDLVSTQPNPPRSGSRDEMLSVYSIVNSLVANLPELQGVVLLWNGQQRPSFAGHLDTGRPLTANESLVASGG